MRLLVLSPQDPREVCLGILVTGSTHRQALGDALSVTHTNKVHRRPRPLPSPPQAHGNAWGPPHGTPRRTQERATPRDPGNNIY